MEFCHSYLFVTFVVMTVDQIVGRDDGPLETGQPRFSKNWQNSDLLEKSESSLHRSDVDV